MKIVVGESPVHGLGVFAAVDLSAGETLERCAYIVIDDDDLQEENRLNDYLFTSPDAPTDYLVVMGCGMLYNHSDNANAGWDCLLYTSPSPRDATLSRMPSSA